MARLAQVLAELNWDLRDLKTKKVSLTNIC